MTKDTKYYAKILAKIAIAISALIGIFLTYKLAIFYIPFIIAMIIAACIEPLIKLLMKFTKIKRKPASIISLILVLLIIGGLLTLGIAKIVSEGSALLSNLNTYFDHIYKWGTDFINEMNEGRSNIPQEVVVVIQNSLTGIIDVVKGWLVGFLKGTLNFVTSIPDMITYGFITILAIIFICFDKEYIPNKIKSQIPTKWFEKIRLIINETCSVSVKYIKAEAKLSLICFIWVLIGLNIVNLIGIKVEYLFIMTVVIGFVDLLPIFGAGAVMLPWTGYLLITGNIPLAIAVTIVWIIWAVIKQLIEPKMVSKEIGIHPIFTLIGMYTGFKLMGVIGMILGPIVLIILKNVFSELIEKGILKSFFELD